MITITGLFTNTTLRLSISVAYLAHCLSLLTQSKAPTFKSKSYQAHTNTQKNGKIASFQCSRLINDNIYKKATINRFHPIRPLFRKGKKSEKWSKQEFDRLMAVNQPQNGEKDILGW